MGSLNDLRKFSYLVYGLGSTGQSVVSFFKKNKINNYRVWDDKNKELFKSKQVSNLTKTLKQVNYIVLSPGISLKKSKNKKKLLMFKNKIITDIDLIFLIKGFFKSIVVTGTNGKSTTCKIIDHILKKNGFSSLLGGNIGTPLLNLKIKKKNFLIIEASSFQLSHSKFINPDYALLLNISNDHLDWHGNMKNYIDSKFKIFAKQKNFQFAFLNKKLRTKYKKKKLLSKLIIPKVENYQKIKSKIKNFYLKTSINDENMSYVFALSKVLKINFKSFVDSINTFKGLPHRYEIFLKKKNCIFINDSKATSFQSSRLALKNTKNTYWIVGGLPKKNDKIILNDLKKNIIKSYIIGKNTHFFKKQIQKKINFQVSKNLKSSIIQIIKDIKYHRKKYNSILLSPAAASYDQFLNFERRGDEFKRLCKYYANEHIKS